ncbi:peptidoglycan/xylan/chitin deacetylase (PgdA/CDA1 family) [Paenibacillus amylolyticus]|uniref:Peptidoglycan/xylan/chitin deacetylase (PgdA/CDA1 family) n=1 Tax=Paenibacillus amylolyticus TaxID=1451 RepID=A0AAP5H1H7_PAEAM|nr:polysaccharide deacetylase family protein [Paenibacillus amylolyticus]MDR6722176.1 peptidoglycan/xylan/chitin deacetylase (PgdA/CDA1 family) [Paenibacillus amylolyticus]
MFRLTATCLIATCLLLTACGNETETVVQNPKDTSSPTVDTTANSNETEDTDQVNNPDKSKPSEASSSQTAREENSDTMQNADAESTQAEIPKMYHMNENYFIKPNDDSLEKKVVLLTFDDGPKEEDMINQLIDTLDKHDAKAIFFVNGYRVQNNPDLLKLIHERGQIIGNHAWDHEDLKKMSNADAVRQVESVQDIVKETIGITPQFFRPPFGSGNDALKAVVDKNDMLYMTWSNGSLDWDKSVKDRPDKVIQNVLDQLNPGSNILMHELPWTVEALDELLIKLKEKGYSFVDPRSIELKVR